jgi:hypothetical protein
MASEDSTLEQEKIFPNDILKNSSFHFTLTQKRIFEKITHELLIKNYDIDDCIHKISAHISIELSPKDRTRLLLKELKILLNPFHSKIEGEIKKELSPLAFNNILVSYDQNFEEDWIQITQRIENENDLNNLKKALEQFSLSSYKDIFNGKINV